MSQIVNQERFEQFVQDHALTIAKADSGTNSVVERGVDAVGCTAACAVYTAGSGAFVIYDNPGDLLEYIVVNGTAWQATHEEVSNLDTALINGTEAVRVYAVDEESALALANAWDDGKIGVDNTVLGEPGLVQKLLAGS